MASGVQLPKIITDVKECIQELQEEFRETDIPIGDDHTCLHRFCAKLEYLLQNAQKEKHTLLGTRKDYWDYFCHCLLSHRSSHDGLRYVKSLSELKTSLGRGRAFIRFCLMHNCLADTLQQCFMNEKVTRDWYYERSALMQREQWSSLTASLYDLNDVHFDLLPGGYELDVSWPTFAKKVFTAAFPSNGWQPPSRTISLTSLVSQNDSSILLHQSACETMGEESHNTEELQQELSQLRLTNSELEGRFKQLQVQYENTCREYEEKLHQHDEVNSAQQTEKLALESHCQHLMQQLQQEREQWQAQKEGLECQVMSAEEATQKYLQQIESCSRNKQATELSAHQTEPELLPIVSDVRHLQNETFHPHETVYNEIEQYKDMVSVLKMQLSDLQKTNSELSSRWEDVGKDTVQILSDRVQELMNKLQASDANLQQVQVARNSLDKKLEAVLATNETMKQLVVAIEQENQLLREQGVVLREDLEYSQEQIEETQKRNMELENELLTLRHELQELSSTNLHCQDYKPMLKLVADMREKLAYISEQHHHLENSEVTIKISDLQALNSTLLANVKQLYCTRQKVTGKVSQDDDEPSDKQVQKISNLELAVCLEKQRRLITYLHQHLNLFLTENQNLNQNICNLQTILHAGDKANISIDGKQNEDDTAVAEVDLPDNVLHAAKECDVMSDPAIQRINSVTEEELLLTGSPLLQMAASLLSSIGNLVKTKNEVWRELCKANSLISNLLVRVRKQDNLCVVVQDVEEAESIVERLKEEHSKLQEAEAILKYELQEKKKLVSRLRQQLESSREEWNKVKLKNFESEAEWHSLREEFALRRQQASEESGFVDDSRHQDDMTPNTSEPVSEDLASPSNGQAISPEPMLASSSADQLMHPCEGAEGGSSAGSPQTPLTTGTEEPRGRFRLEMLEEQCRILYVSLLRSYKRSEFLEQRLHSLFRDSDGEEEVETSDSSESLPIDDLQSDTSPVLMDLQNSLEDITAIENTSENSAAVNLDTVDQCRNDEVLTHIPTEEASDNTNSLFAATDTFDGNEIQMNVETRSGETPSCSTSMLAISSAASLRKQTLESMVNRFKSEREMNKARESKLQAEVAQLLNEKAELESKLALLQQEKTQVCSRESDLKKRADLILRQERTRFHVAQAEHSLQQQHLSDLNVELDNRNQSILALENALHTLREEMASTQQNLEEELSLLQCKLTDESAKYENILKHYEQQQPRLTEIQEQIEGQEQFIHSLGELLQRIKVKRMIEQQQHSQELEVLQIALSTRDEECIAINEALKKATLDLDIEQKKAQFVEKQMQELSRESKEEIAFLQDELLQVKSDNSEMKKVLVKLIKEKDRLWKRAEKLTYLNQLQVADRWIDDGEVDQCMNCETAFSFTVRKHHCRLCGRIFCRACVDNWVMTTSSSRRARTCDTCYARFKQKELEASQGSSIVLEDESDDDANANPAGTSVASYSVSSCDSVSHILESRGSVSSSSIQVEDVVVKTEGSISCSVPTSIPGAKCRNVRGQSSDSSDSSVEDNVAKAENATNDFDIITDEEIAHSLSACSPYNSFVGKMESQDGSMLMSGTRTIEDIQEGGPEGSMGEVWINAGQSYGVPLLLEETDLSIHWMFTCESRVKVLDSLSHLKTIAFSVLYKEVGTDGTESQELQTLLTTTRVKTTQHPVEGTLVVHKPGLYILVFDNHFSKFLAKKVQYYLKVVKTSTSDSSTELTSEE